MATAGETKQMSNRPKSQKRTNDRKTDNIGAKNRNSKRATNKIRFSALSSMHPLFQLKYLFAQEECLGFCSAGSLRMKELHGFTHMGGGHTPLQSSFGFVFKQQCPQLILLLCNRFVCNQLSEAAVRT